jgi:hypothetical protein
MKQSYIRILKIGMIECKQGRFKRTFELINDIFNKCFLQNRLKDEKARKETIK